MKLPQYPDTSKEHKGAKKALPGTHQTPSEILESVFRPEDAAKKKWKRIAGAMAAQEKVQEEAEAEAARQGKQRSQRWQPGYSHLPNPLVKRGELTLPKVVKTELQQR